MVDRELVAWARRYKADRPDWPLTVLPSGYWVKKIGGRQIVFGRLDDPDGALVAYRAYVGGDGATGSLAVRDGVNLFLAAMHRRARSGAIGWGQYKAYRMCGRRIVTVFGPQRSVESLRPDDFARLLDLFREVRTGEGIRLHVVETRTLFRWLADNGHLDRPVRWGTEFRGPTRRERQQSARAVKFWSPSELRRLVDPASLAGHFSARSVPFWRAAILLGINCAFTQVDIAELPVDAVDYGGRMITFPRPKTMETRRCPLWAETVVAMQNYAATRPDATRGNLARFFLTRRGRPWILPASERRSKIDQVGKPFRIYCRSLGLWLPGRGFGSLRHVVGTVGRETRELDAVELILGHAGNGITARHYLHHVPDEALWRVVDRVHEWMHEH